jgi:hypothetical protein
VTLRGDAAVAQGDATSALRHFQESLEMAARRGDGLQVSNDVKCLVPALVLAGDPAAALETAGAAAAIAAEGGHTIAFPDVEAAIDAARRSVGARSAELFGAGLRLTPGERVPRVMALASLTAQRAAE